MKKKRFEGGPSQGDGSVGSYLDEVKGEKSKPSRLEGIAEAAEVAERLEQLGELRKKYPELTHWVDRNLEALGDLSQRAQEGEDVSAETKGWLDETKEGADWGIGRRDGENDMLLYPRVGAGLQATKEIGGAIAAGKEAPEKRAEDMNTLVEIERSFVHRYADQQTADEIERLCKAYNIELSESFRARFEPEPYGWKKRPQN